jgi:hypothetical protein
MQSYAKRDGFTLRQMIREGRATYTLKQSVWVRRAAL